MKKNRKENLLPLRIFLLGVMLKDKHSQGSATADIWAEWTRGGGAVRTSGPQFVYVWCDLVRCLCSIWW